MIKCEAHFSLTRCRVNCPQPVWRSDRRLRVEATAGKDFVLQGPALPPVTPATTLSNFSEGERQVFQEAFEPVSLKLHARTQFLPREGGARKQPQMDAGVTAFSTGRIREIFRKSNQQSGK